MKKNRFYINLDIIIPLIIAGFAILSAIVSFQLTQHALKNKVDANLPLFYWIVIIGLVAYLCGLLLVRFLLSPAQRFVDQAKQIPAVSTHELPARTQKRDSELSHIEHVFDMVTDVLSKVDARQSFPEIKGESRAMRSIMSQILKVAPTDSTVLIFGESGTGKELVAKSICRHSLRREKPFVKLNCAAIPSELLESELFGYEKGAFTGASTRKSGKFEQAHGGTLFLDEIGDMPLELQAKILRVLQEKEFDRLGGTKPVKVDVRIIAATNKNLEKMVQAGKFREDLYYRLNVFGLVLPPLRERREDIPLISEFFLENMEGRVTISSAAQRAMMNYAWPGNIRELQNTIERAAVVCDGEIEMRHLPANITGKAMTSPTLPDISQDAPSLDDCIRSYEKRLIEEALLRSQGVQAEAAKILQINPRSLWHRVKKYEIDITPFKRTTNNVD